MVTKSLQVRPHNNQGITTALLSTSILRAGWEERSWFSPLTFQWQGHFKLWLKKRFWVIQTSCEYGSKQDQSTLGLGLPPLVFTLLEVEVPPSLASWPAPSREGRPPRPAGTLRASGAPPTHGTAGRSSRSYRSPPVTGHRWPPGQSLSNSFLNLVYLFLWKIDQTKKLKVFKSAVTFHRKIIYFCLMFCRN